MNSTSPPTGVHASPVATPGREVRRRVSEKNLRFPSSSRTRGSVIVTFRFDSPLGDLPGDLAADRPDLALELAHPGLARVVGDDHPQRRVA